MAKQRGPDGTPIDIPSQPPNPLRPGGDDVPTVPPGRGARRLFPEEPATRPASWPSDPLRQPGQAAGDQSPAVSAPADPRTRIHRGGLGKEAETQEDPVTGWLVIVDGPGKGQFVRIGHGQNIIGRGAAARIRLDFGDDLVSRENNGAVTYDPAGRRFYVQQGTGPNLLYLDDAPVLAPAELPDRAELRIGKTRMRFVALCGTDFSWDAA
jgi:hypothetical protein